MPNSTIYVGDVMDVLPTLDPESHHACFCDPPYGLSFMGRDWDHGVPGVSCWEAVRRVLKPGGLLLAFGGSRTFHRLAVAVEDAGFEIRDTIMWMYGTGFPKSADVSKHIDKEAGAEREMVPATGRLHENANLNDDGWSKIGADSPMMEGPEPATPEAEQWDGYGTALKPAFEPIIVARKPLDGTYARTAQAHGSGALNIDGARIETDETIPDFYRPDAHVEIQPGGHNPSKRTGGGTGKGRWPANVILDEDAARGLDRQSGISLSTGGKGEATQKNSGDSSYGWERGEDWQGAGGYGDTGGASRFFYVAKASKSDRNAGLQGRSNRHPTVKPLELTSYLARLICPPEHVDSRLLVPFSGSGSEMIGGINGGWKRVTGIEQDPENADVAQERIIGVAPLLNRCEVVEQKKR